MKEIKKCFCGSDKDYSQCCGPIHDNIFNAKTSEQLMRSRYSAFCLADGEYLHKSHHSSTRAKSKNEIREIAEWAKSVIWMKLEIVDTSEGLEKDDFGIVEFKAYYLESGKSNVIHEKSTFRKENGHWVYVDGIHF